MSQFQVNSIGTIHLDGEGASIRLEEKYIPALQALDGFSHVNVVWWFSSFDDEESRNILDSMQPYKKAPAIMGVFATRSPIRPNPIALTAVQVIRIDHEKGVIHIAYIDAEDGTPVLDVKPYTPSLDRVETPEVPEWCSDWPKSIEASAHFAWEDVFNF